MGIFSGCLYQCLSTELSYSYTPIGLHRCVSREICCPLLSLAKFCQCQEFFFDIFWPSLATTLYLVTCNASSGCLIWMTLAWECHLFAAAESAVLRPEKVEWISNDICGSIFRCMLCEMCEYMWIMWVPLNLLNLRDGDRERGRERERERREKRERDACMHACMIVCIDVLIESHSMVSWSHLSFQHDIPAQKTDSLPLHPRIRYKPRGLTASG